MAEKAVTAELLVAWAHEAERALGAARAEIDRLNVFPVPDGDTGTNMYLTMEAAVQEVEGPGGAELSGRLAERYAGAPTEIRRLAAVAQSISRGALMGARGNSGVILSQILRGLVGLDSPNLLQRGSAGRIMADALRAATRLAYSAVAHPVEGTMLTVIRGAAESAEAAATGELVDVARAAVHGAEVTLERTPTLLPALAEAGVVDSGGKGVLVVLEAFVSVVTGQRRAARARPSRPVGVSGHRPHPDYDGPAYEVMFLLEAEPSGRTIDPMRAELDALGDSLVIVGGDGLWNVHVHVDDAGAAVESAISAGRPFQIRISWLRHAEEAPPTDRTGRALVAVSHGPGVTAILHDAGVQHVDARPGVSPSTGELLAAIESTHAAEVVLLPGSKDIVPAAEAAAERARKEGIRVAVVPTRAIVQSLAAIAVHDGDRRFDDAVAAMGRASGATRYGAVTVSTKRAMTMAGVCEPGDVLGLADGEIVEIGDSIPVVTHAVARQMVRSSSELITVLTGSDLDPDEAEGIEESLQEEFASLEVELMDGGQPLWPVIIGVE